MRLGFLFFIARRHLFDVTIITMRRIAATLALALAAIDLLRA